MSRKYAIVAILVVLVLASWLAFGTKSTETVALFTTPNRGPFKVDVTTTGELRAKNSTSIRGPEGTREFRIFNLTIQRLVPEGTLVKKGDFVAELDRSELTNSLQDAMLELEEAKSQLELAQLDSSLNLSSDRDQLVNLQYALEEAEIGVEQSKFESPAVQRQANIDLERAQRDLEQAKKSYATQVKKAEANIREIQADLQQEQREVQRIQETMQRFTIYAPENGMVIYRRNRDGSKVAEGSNVSAWDPVVAELPDFSVMESVTYVNEVDIQKVREGQQVDVGLDAMPDKRLTGVITDVANIGEQRPNSDSKVFQVVIEVNETDSTLRPAMTTSNVIHVNALADAMFVPLETVHTVDSMNYVFKRSGLEPVMQQVILGIMNENDVVIHEGLSLDDQVYLSTPEDTSGISRDLLPAEIVKKYKKEQPAPREDGNPQQMQQQRQIPDEIRRRMRQFRNDSTRSGSGGEQFRRNGGGGSN